MTTQIVLATGNPGKLHEFRELLAARPIHLVPQSDFAVPAVEETGLSFVENALIKARHAAAITGLPAIADDSGLEVDALRGAPGIYSARFAGPGASDEANNAKLLEQLQGFTGEQRRARFQCLLVYLRHAHDPTPVICQGTWEGLIASQRSGDQGFGYDPLFFVPDQQCTAAALSRDTKNRLSHRGQAMRQLLDRLPFSDGQPTAAHHR